MVRSATEISSLRDIRTMHSSKKRSIPRIQSSAYLDLYMLRKEKDRLEKESGILNKRNKSVQKRIDEIGGDNENYNPECVLPMMWEEVGFIHKKCQLKEVEKLSGYHDTFNFPLGNGSFDYCNTLIFRKYNSLQGYLYTYEKVRYKHYPNSEVGEYVMPESIYETITNSRKCDGDTNDDDISSESFPSRNFKLNENSPCFFSRLFSGKYIWTGDKERNCN